LGINFRETVGFNGEGYDTQLGGSPPPHAWAQSNYYNPEELRPYSLQMAGEYVSNILSQIQETALGWLGNLSSLFKNSEQSAGISAALFTSMEGLKMQTEAFLADFALADTEPVKIEVAQLPQAKSAIAVLPPAPEVKPIAKEPIKEEIKQPEIKEAQPEAQPVEKKIYYGSGGGGGNSGGTSAPIESEKTIFEETTTTTDETTTSTDETATSTEEIDLTPPMAVIDLNANYGDNRGEIKLSWTAPGDADEYIIRWATSTITSSTWDLASDVSGEPAPGAFNERESFTAGELDIGQTYYFALKSTDGTGNISEISNIASSSPSALASSVIISEVQIYDIYDREFVELYNPTNSDIDMSNWHLLYFPSSRDWNNPSSNKEFLNGAVIPAKGYYLIGLNGFSQDKFIHFDWLAPSFPQINNYSGSLVISASSSAATEEVRIDTLGWGSAQYVFEGSPAAAPEQYHSLTRRTAGWDTDDNSADFITKDWPNPRNSLGNSVTIVSDKIKITENSVWDLAGSPYLLESNHTSYPTVTASTTLTIKPGVTVKGVSKDYPSLLVKGVLKAQGTADNPIVFTANTSTPQNGGWSEIVFDGADDGSVLNYVNFEYGGYPAAYGTKTFNEMLRIIGSDVVIQNSTFKNSLNGAVYLENSSSSISNSVFSNNTSTAIVVSGSLSAPTIENCRFENNGGNGIDILSEASPVITNNVFSNNFYPITMISSYPALSGNEATGNNLNGIIVEQDSVFRKDAVWKADALAYVLFSGWGQAPTVATGTVLTIEPGTVIKPYSPYYTALKIEGELVAEGAAGTPIVFTSLKDDDYVGDTNNDGSTTTPTAGDWKDIEFATGSRGRLSHILFRYGPDNINTNANVVLGDNIIYEPKLAPE
ncbi:right-handed parallel beta-helix repeat-containing protein, partial [Patescibacteria group bacterium]|nr:right-handed parallel beta-helix repeat-containing protein [Patescibacteria group bacterium]